MRVSLMISLASTGFFVMPATAQRDSTMEEQPNQFGICTKASQVTSDILDCLGDANRRDDKVLNQTYQQIMSRLDAARRARLRASERHWLAARKRDCNAEATAYSTGSWWSVMYASCIDDSTNMRVTWLRQHYR